MVENRKNLGHLLVDIGLITKHQLHRALKLQKTSGEKLEQILVEEGMVQERQIIGALEFQFGIPHIDIEKHFIDPKIPRLISENLARRNTLIPVKKERDRLIVAMADPLNIFAIDDVKIATGLEVEPVITARQDIINAIDQYYNQQSAEKAIEDFKKEYTVKDLEKFDEEVLYDINNAPMVRLVNLIIKQAVKSRASDIHIEPLENSLRVRLRIDGELQEIMKPTKITHSAIVTRIKIMGKMDIAEKRIPQDGRLETSIDGKELDIRIAILPTVYGEKIVMRLLDRSGFLLSKSQLGFSKTNLEIVERIIKKPNGMILVTGPTGSGKTTTLYTILRELNRIEKNIITVEDPVEYRLQGVSQVQVNTKTGLTFANTLRSILRQDPDIIMIGEIRDSETAQIAIRAAITGHLVLSTMHTNDASSTITRLMDMGIEPYMVSSALGGVIAQRLVRKICHHCKTSYIPTIREKKLIGVSSKIVFYKGEGCTYCNNTGYKGRTALHEVMSIEKNIRMQINQTKSIDALRQTAFEQGMSSLKETGIKLVLEGITTVEELMKVTYSLD